MLKVLQGVLDQSSDSLLFADGKCTFYAQNCRLFMLAEETKEQYVIPVTPKMRKASGRDILWILPDAISGKACTFVLKDHQVRYQVKKYKCGFLVEITGENCQYKEYPTRPYCDFFENTFSFSIPDGELFAKTVAAFYWDSILPMTVEKTIARKNRYSDGYVLSTLQKGAYPGTYPDVDHEFQIKSRIALAGKLEADIVRRMIGLQLAVMRDDPEGKWRNPCSVQPRGNREYHVDRRCKNLKNKAVMFLLTGNIEVIESAWLYYALTKDLRWLRDKITGLESAMGFVLSYIDDKGLLWSDVYYEDQVIKDGRETIAQAFAANGFSLLAQLEGLLERNEKQQQYLQTAKSLGEALVRPLPEGYWDDKTNRFIDWVDRAGKMHDHIHLLANELPVTFGYTSDRQCQAVKQLLSENQAVFDKFPSFVAAKIEDYTNDEIGTGGPYDLCAAGRYWCWDARYLSDLNACEALRRQLRQVATQAEQDDFLMGERYDMNYIYYLSDKNWHGAAHYYEYPNVFVWVLIHEYFGLKPHLVYDYTINPKLNGFGTVKYGAIEYCYQQDLFSFTNHGDTPLRIVLDLSAIYQDVSQFICQHDGTTIPNQSPVTVEPGQTFIVNIIK